MQPSRVYLDKDHLDCRKFKVLSYSLFIEAIFRQPSEIVDCTNISAV